jgi:signal transduction histidine kinase
MLTLFRNAWQRHPLKFLLCLEWVLLVIVALTELPMVGVMALPRRLGVLWLGLFGLTWMGLYLPQVRSSRLSHRQLYTLLELVLVVVTTLVGGSRLFSLLLIIVVMRNCLLLEGQLRNGVTLFAFGFSVLTWWYRWFAYYSPTTLVAEQLVRIFLFSVTLLSGLVMLFLQLLVTAILAERSSREQLALANQQLRDYALQVEALATAQERNRIAREIHDALGHSLTVFNLHLDAALQLWRTDPQEAHGLLVEAKQVAATTLQEVRQSVAELRADPLAGQLLSRAIQGLCDDFQRGTGIQPHYTCPEFLELPQSIKLALYRIVQESLTNICKYAQASQVSIQVRQEAGQLMVTITDDGQGFDPQTNTTGFGLQGMRERTLGLGGEWQLHSSPGRGCKIQVKLLIS